MDKEATLDAVESSLDVIEETVDTVKKVSPGHFNLNGTTKGQQIAILGGAVLVGALVGGGVTYILTKKRLSLKFEEIAKQEIEEAKTFYKNLHKDDTSPQDILEKRHGKDAVDALRDYQGRFSPSKVDAPVPTEDALLVDKEDAAAHLEQVEGRVVETVSVFDQGEADPDIPGWDYATEVARRTGDAPYIISHDEFFENEPDYEQVQITYYEGDGVLVDDQDMPIPDSNSCVGDDNLVQFGHGSKDENIVYIRNDTRGLNYEVVRHEGKYAHHVLGLDLEEDELKHSHRPSLRKFRADDD